MNIIAFRFFLLRFGDQSY